MREMPDGMEEIIDDLKYVVEVLDHFIGRKDGDDDNVWTLRVKVRMNDAWADVMGFE